MQVGHGGGGCCSEVSGVLAKKVSASLDLKGQHKGGCTFYFLLCKAWLYFLSAPMGTWVVEGPTFFLCSGGMRASCRREGGGRLLADVGMAAASNGTISGPVYSPEKAEGGTRSASRLPGGKRHLGCLF